MIIGNPLYGHLLVSPAFDFMGGRHFSKICSSLGLPLQRPPEQYRLKALNLGYFEEDNNGQDL
jgi:hypothetical protein